MGRMKIIACGYRDWSIDENTYFNSGTQTYTAENIINLGAPKYYFLKINTNLSFAF